MVVAAEKNDDNDGKLYQLHTDKTEAIISQAVQQWLDKKWAKVGRWTIGGLAVWLFGAVCHAWLTMHSKQIQEFVGAAITSN